MASRRPRASTYIAGRLQDLTRMRSTPTAACCVPELSSNVRFCNSRRCPPKSLSRRSEPVSEINVAQPLCHKVLRPFSPTLLYGGHHRSIRSAKNRLDGRSLPHQGVGRRLQPRAPYRQGVQLTRPHARVVTQRLGDGTPRFGPVAPRLDLGAPPSPGNRRAPQLCARGRANGVTSAPTVPSSPGRDR
jgi:hypothetical protein